VIKTVSTTPSGLLSCRCVQAPLRLQPHHHASCKGPRQAAVLTQFSVHRKKRWHWPARVSLPALAFSLALGSRLCSTMGMVAAVLQAYFTRLAARILS